MIFKNWVLQNFPFLEDDFDALTDYELFCKMIEYMKKSLEKLSDYQKQIDEFSAKLDEFQHYFDDLDIQEEVDKKLDEMAESGELTDIIAQYLQLAGVLAYNTLDDLENAENIVNGSICMILGKDTYNDGKTAYYKIRAILNTDVIDGDNIIGIVNDNNLVGEKIINYNEQLIKAFEKEQNLYLSAFFESDSDISSYIYLSNNGKSFTRASNIPWNQVRDVDMIFYNNKFYAITTQTTGDTSIADLYVSENLENWSRKALYIDFNQPSTYRNYPCEWFVDTNGDVYLSGAYQVGTMTDSVTGDTLRDFRIYVVKVLNMDFDNFELDEPVILSNLNYNLIDPHITKKNDTYYMFAKKEGNDSNYNVGTIQTITSLDLSTWTKISNTISSLGNYRFEGASVVKIDNTYYMYLDNYNGGLGGGMFYITSNDLSVWSNPAPLECGGYPVRHGSIRKIEGIGQKIASAYSETNSNDYVNQKRKNIILPKIDSNNSNKYIEIGTFNILQDYSSFKVELSIKDIENDSYDSLLIIDITKKGENLSSNIEEKLYKFHGSNLFSLVKISNYQFKLYLNTTNFTSTTPSIVINNIIARNTNISFNENMAFITSLPSGTVTTPLKSNLYLSNSNTFRIEGINTFASETSITATFSTSTAWSSFSCIMMARSHCILFYAQMNGTHEISTYGAYDLTGRGTSYTTTINNNKITISGLSAYDEYILYINDSTSGKILFTK